MATEDKVLLAFNRGVISPRGLARVDLERMGMSADIQTNWIPRVLGSMQFRPGTEFIDTTKNDAIARLMPFTFGVDDTAVIELSTLNMRVLIDDVFLNYPAHGTSITNGSFAGVVPDANWTDQSDAGGVVGHSAGQAELSGDGTGFGRYEQSVTVAAPDQGVEHAVFVQIKVGPVHFKIGSISGDDDYVAETDLGKGWHYLAFTPTGGNFFIQFSNEREYNAEVEEVNIVASGELNVNTIYDVDDLPFLRWDQSGDVIYLCTQNGSTGTDPTTEAHLKIERRGNGRSWSMVFYLPEDGPFRVQNTSGIALTASALVGNITLTSSQPLFKAEHANDGGALFRIASSGQVVTAAASAQDVQTDSIRVTGTENAREFGIIIEGTFVATVHLQFSFDDVNWNDQGTTYTALVSTTYKDGQDGQVIYYRLNVKTGNYTSGTVTMTLNYSGGSIQGIARITAFTSSLVVDAIVLKAFGAITASKDWWEGDWSRFRGYPTSVGLHEGRLWWAGNDKIFGSQSDAYEGFDDNTFGDSGPISRSIGWGPQRIIHWLVSMGRLMFGTSDNSANVLPARIDGNSPLGARSNSFDEPLSPSNFNIKTISSKGVFVDRSEQRLYELNFNPDNQDYQSLDLSVYAPDYNEVGIVHIAVQIKPDVRIHCVRSDGTVGMLVFDRLENVICWVEVDFVQSVGFAGKCIDVAILPGVVEDQVYYVMERLQVASSPATQRHIVKWALESEAIGASVNKMADSFVHYSGAATVTPFTTELLHLEGETVTIWADGIDVGVDIVDGAGALTNALATAASNVVVGLSYRARFKSAKLGDIQGIGLLERKFVQRIGFIAQNLHYQGLKYGPTFDELYDLPQVEQGQVQADNTIYAEYHEDDFSFGGEWETDSRICLEATAPRPATILATIAEIKSVEKISSDIRRRSR